MLDRLTEAITRAGIPLATVSGAPPSPTLTFRPEATQGQIDQANAIVAGFDWSQATHDAWLRTKERPLAQRVINQLSEQGMILRALVAVLVDEINLLRGQIVGVASTTWDPANMANGTGVTSPAVTVTGAAFGDAVDVIAPYSLQGILATAYVSAPETVQVRLHNATGGAINLASGQWTVVVRRHAALPARTLAQAKTAVANKLNSGEVDNA